MFYACCPRTLSTYGSRAGFLPHYLQTRMAGGKGCPRAVPE
jgi:hypothetical protein